MRTLLRYSVAASLLTALLFLLLSLVFRGAESREALLMSAAVALLVQVVLFALVRLASTENVMMAWSLGTVARFVVLILFAVLVVPSAGLSIAPALLGMATCFFACTLLETVFLTR